MAKKGRLTKPSVKKFREALRGADIFVVNRHEDDIKGCIGNEIIGPLYWDYLNLWDRCSRLMALPDTPEWIKGYLRESVTWHGVKLTRK